jgi:hypothetical protein
MANYAIRLLLLILFLNSFSLSAQPGLPLNVRQKINLQLSEWTSTFSVFKTTAFVQSDTLQATFISDSGTYDQLDSFYAIYKPLIRFSPDKRYFIDSYSYQLNLEREGGHLVANPEIDQQVLLYDTKTGKTGFLFFGGPESWIDEESWIDNNTVLLAGVQKDESAARHPFFYVLNVKKGLIVKYQCTNDSCIQSRLYKSPRLAAMKINGI